MRVWPRLQPSVPFDGPWDAVVPEGTDTNPVKENVEGKQSSTTVSCRGGRPLALAAVRVKVTCWPPMAVVGLAALFSDGLGSTMVANAEAVTGVLAGPPGVVVDENVAVLVRLVPLVFDPSVEMRAWSVRRNTWSVGSAFT